jgi:hypothetical protein
VILPSTRAFTCGDLSPVRRFLVACQVSGDATDPSHIRTMRLRLIVPMHAQVVILQSVVFCLAAELELRPNSRG